MSKLLKKKEDHKSIGFHSKHVLFQILNVSAIVLANLCVAYIMTSQNEEVRLTFNSLCDKIKHVFASLFLAHLSTKCSWWAIVVSGCPSSVVVCSVSTFDVYTLKTTFVAQSWRNFVRMFVLTISRLSSNMGHVGSKTRSPGQILGNSCLHSRGHICDQILMKLCQNVCLDNI